MMTKTVMVIHEGKKHFIEIPYNGNESNEKLQDKALVLLKRRESKMRKRKSEHVLSLLESGL